MVWLSHLISVLGVSIRLVEERIRVEKMRTFIFVECLYFRLFILYTRIVIAEEELRVEITRTFVFY